MTPREINIGKRILNYLHELNGGQAHPLIIHAEIGGMACCGSAEFDSVLGLLDGRKYIVVIPSRFKGQMINISDLGEAARLQM